MDTPDAAAVAQLAQKLGLVSEDQLIQVWDDVGKWRSVYMPAILKIHDRNIERIAYENSSGR